MANITTRKGYVLQDPPLIQKLLNDPRAGFVWVFLRVWLGYQWIHSSLAKVTNPKWVETGEALQGFWLNAVKIPETGRPPISFDWYRSFIQALLDAQAYTWFAKVVAYGEMLVGIALILGAFTGIAAFFGGVMNWNFMMAGSASTNPMLFIIAVGLILAWKVAGTVGADYFLLRWIGVPWQKGEAGKQSQAQAYPVRDALPGD
ncbi:MAG: DoxX family membrane protein [Chloroflexota bacterium]|nr:MAG: DoxX family membrane protein [Chloroflexota bacterium]